MYAGCQGRLKLIGFVPWLSVGAPLPAFGQLVRLEEATRIDGAVFALDYDPVDRVFLVGARTDPVTHAIFVGLYGLYGAVISGVVLSNDRSLNVLGPTSYLALSVADIAYSPTSREFLESLWSDAAQKQDRTALRIANCGQAGTVSSQGDTRRTVHFLNRPVGAEDSLKPNMVSRGDVLR